jgi:hypothetical protein
MQYASSLQLPFALAIEMDTCLAPKALQAYEWKARPQATPEFSWQLLVGNWRGILLILKFCKFWFRQNALAPIQKNNPFFVNNPSQIHKILKSYYIWRNETSISLNNSCPACSGFGTNKKH